MQFVPQIVNGLMKLGLHNQASPENRKLSLDLAGLIVYWEQRRLAESRNKDQVTITLRGLMVMSQCTSGMMSPCRSSSSWPGAVA